MESNSLSENIEYLHSDNVNILKKSKALNDSLSLSYPLVISFILSFDEALNNMRIFLKLNAYEDGIESTDLSNQDLFIYCHNQGLIDGRLGDWLYYQALRKKITPNLDKITVDEIIKISSKFSGEITTMIIKLEKKLSYYRTIN